jgi:hypothetical protein
VAVVVVVVACVMDAEWAIAHAYEVPGAFWALPWRSCKASC